LRGIGPYFFEIGDHLLDLMPGGATVLEVVDGREEPSNVSDSMLLRMALQIIECQSGVDVSWPESAFRAAHVQVREQD
jgi:hypothetical protein